MENDNIQQIIHIINEINREISELENQLNIEMIDEIHNVINDINNFFENYVNQRFIPNENINEMNDETLKNELKKGETIFDQNYSKLKQIENICAQLNKIDAKIPQELDNTLGNLFYI